MSASLDLPLERGRIARDRHSVTIELTPRIRPFLKLGIAVWLVVAGIVMTATAGGSVEAPPGVRIAFLSVFGLFAMGALFLLAWGVAGREVIHADRDSVRVSRRLLGLVLGTKQFDRRRVKEMRVDEYWTPDGDALRAASMDGWSRRFGLTGGVVAFEYERSTHRFGALIGAGDARIVIANIGAVAPGVEEIDPDRPPLRRATMVERRGGVLIEVPPSRASSTAGATLLFMTIALGMMLVLAFADVRGLEHPMQRLLGLAFLTALFLWCAFVFAATMWREETIAVDDDRIVVERRLLGMVNRAELAIVPEATLGLDEDHREEAVTGGGRRGVALPTSLNVGPIVYQAPRLTVRFGDGLSRAEAQYIVHRIHEKSPSLVS